MADSEERSEESQVEAGSSESGGYGSKWKKYLLIYLVVGAVAYFLIYLVFFKDGYPG